MIKNIFKAFICLSLLGFIVTALFMYPDSSSTAEALSADDIENIAEPRSGAEALSTVDIENIAEPRSGIVPLKVAYILDGNGLKSFSSYQKLKEFVGTDTQIWWTEYGIRDMYFHDQAGFRPTIFMAASVEEVWAAAPDYSGTNIQVEGVDEADIVKTDGKYIYIVREDTIVIVEAYPLENAGVLCEIALEGSLQSMYINGDLLVVFETVVYEQTSNTQVMPDDTLKVEMSIPAHPYKTHVRIYDVSDRVNPVLAREAAVDGHYWDSRMIGDHVYMVVKEQPYCWEEELFIPRIYIGDTTYKVPATDILYPEGDGGYYNFATVISVDVNKGIQDTQDLEYGMFLLESGTNMYASENNLYFTYTGYNNDSLYYTSHTTVIHRIHLEEGEMEYNATGEVPGTVLNQFSMDEYMGYFRMATTVNGTRHNVYTLDGNLDIAGRLEDFAPIREHLHSARFMGDRCYIVTFRQTDPLFVIDLSDPYLPEVLGELEITGYSDYLHPYDENHLIGIGKEATIWGRFQGVKISLFDVSDVSNPQEVAKYIIGERGTESPVLDNHKALLFDRSRNLLVLPVLDNESYHNTWQGAYVFHISPEEGLVLRGQITHCEDDLQGDYYYSRSCDSWIERSLYIDDILYTLSDVKIGMNSLEDLSEIGEIVLPVS